MRILNFGSINIDYVYKVDNFVKPGETISSLSLERFCGGKGFNQSIALSKSGACVYHAGCICKDDIFLIETLQKSGVNTDFIKTISSPTGHAIIQVDKSGQNCIVLFGGANHCITDEYIQEVFNNFDAGDWLLIQNEICGLDKIIETAYSKGLKIALNPSPMNETINKLPLEKISCFIMNETEGADITGKQDTDDIIEVMKSKYPDATVILTLGQVRFTENDPSMIEFNKLP